MSTHRKRNRTSSQRRLAKRGPQSLLTWIDAEVRRRAVLLGSENKVHDVIKLHERRLQQLGIDLDDVRAHASRQIEMAANVGQQQPTGSRIRSRVPLRERAK